jgi:hypothetical protein
MSSEELGRARGLTLVPGGSDRGLRIGGVGSIELVEDLAPAAA